MNSWSQEAGYPKLIASNRIGNRPDLKQVFASLKIDSNWPGFPSSFDRDLNAAVWANQNNMAYFFKGSQYVKVNPANNWEMEPGYPKPIAGNWPDLPASFASGIDAAVSNTVNNMIYFFKGNQYVKVNPSNGWHMEPGYPKLIEGNWPGFPASFASGIDAAIWSGTNKMIYFFKGSQYIKVNPNNAWKVESGYPKPIAGNWPGLSAPFTNKLDCALWNGKSSNIYFFSGAEYVKINPGKVGQVEKY